MSARRSPELLFPGVWTAADRGPRVLVEHPDAAERAAHARVLRAAGYSVAVCEGPSRAARTVCPLAVGGRCGLVEEADAVVSTTTLEDSEAIAAALQARAAPRLVLEGTAAELGGDAAGLALPVTRARLLAALDDALPSQS